MPHHKPMVSLATSVPDGLKADAFTLRPLLASDAVADHDAWSASREHLEGVFGPGSSWPPDAMSIEDNAIDLAWHQREHESRASFAFTVVAPVGERCLGCVYISPPRAQGFDAEVFLWVRAEEAPALDADLEEAVRRWLEADWPFEAVVFPGRDIAWAEYLARPPQPHW